MKRETFTTTVLSILSETTIPFNILLFVFLFCICFDLILPPLLSGEGWGEVIVYAPWKQLSL